jgi:N6-adenosine-specific RNA methylase IME4
VYSEEKTEHSKKPEFYYKMIEDLYPNSKKIELFARNKRYGWESFGDQ